MKTLQPCALAALVWLAAVSASFAAEPMDWQGRAAFRLTDGKTEAVIVPELAGRVMRFGAVGGANWMWNAADPGPRGVWANVGGDKTFLGPHPAWTQFAARVWPPPFASWDTEPHRAEALADGRLRTTGPVWQHFGARVVREFSFAADGAFVITQTIEQVAEGGLPIAVWNVTQIPPPDAVFLPADAQGADARGFHPLGKLPPEAAIERLSPALLRVQPTTARSYKLGVNPPVAAIAAVKDGVAFLQRAAEPPVRAADGASFPIEYYNHGASGAGQYVELELLSARRALRPGEKLTQTVRWTLHALPAGEQAAGEIARLLAAPAATPARE